MFREPLWDRSRQDEDALDRSGTVSVTKAGPEAQRLSASSTPMSTETLVSRAGERRRFWSRNPLRSQGATRDRSEVAARARRRARALVAAALAVVLVASWAGDQHRRSAEFTTLITVAARGQAVVMDADRRVQSMIEYVSPLLHAARTPPDVRAGLRQLVQTQADQAAASLRADATSIEAISVWSWHSQQIRARDDYVAELQAWAAYYQQFMTVQASVAPVTRQSAVQAATTTTRRAFLDAATNASQRRQVALVLPQ